MENEIFKRYSVDYKKLEAFGFVKNKEHYVYECNFMNDNFKAIVEINQKNSIKGQVIDLASGEEYINIKMTEINGDFVNTVRTLYQDILINIRNNCFNKKLFLSEQANRITKYIIDKYQDEPEFLWPKFDGFGVFRQKKNNKWYAIIMNLKASKFSLGTGEIEVINVKCDEDTITSLIQRKGFYEGYHMNKKNLITIVLNDTVSDTEIFERINQSYALVSFSSL